MKKIEQKDLFELKNVGQPVAGDASFYRNKNERKRKYVWDSYYKYTADLET